MIVRGERSLPASLCLHRNVIIYLPLIIMYSNNIIPFAQGKSYSYTGTFLLAIADFNFSHGGLISHVVFNNVNSSCMSEVFSNASE